MCRKSYSTAAGLRLTTFTNTEIFHPTTDWMPASSLDAWSFDVLVRAQAGQTFTCRPGYQLAEARIDKPTAPVAVDTDKQHSGWWRFAPAVPSISSAAFIRFGLFYRAGAAGYTQADVQVDLALQMHGDGLGTTTIEVEPFNDNAEVMVYPLTGWLHTVGRASAKAGIVITNNLNAMKTQLFVRYADDRDAPSATWAGIEAAFNTAAAGNSERNTGDRSLTIGGHWMQLRGPRERPHRSRWDAARPKARPRRPGTGRSRRFGLGVQRDTTVSRATVQVHLTVKST